MLLSLVLFQHQNASQPNLLDSQLDILLLHMLVSQFMLITRGQKSFHFGSIYLLYDMQMSRLVLIARVEKFLFWQLAIVYLPSMEWPSYIQLHRKSLCECKCSILYLSSQGHLI